MFAAVPYDVLRDLHNATAIALYAVLKMFAGADGKSHPSRMTLAACLGFKTRKPVDAAILELERVGLVRSFPRFKDEDGNIGYGKDDRFKEQTSNGYLIYDRIRVDEPGRNPGTEGDPPVSHRVQPPQEKGTGLSPTGDGGCTPQGITPIPCGVHEGDTNKEIQGRRGEGGHETPVAAPAATEQPPTESTSLEIQESWIAEPRLARCAAHAGIDTPPPCRGCGAARRAAEFVQRELREDKQRRAEARRAAIDACDECDPSGWVPDADGRLMRCSHGAGATDEIRAEVSS